MKVGDLVRGRFTDRYVYTPKETPSDTELGIIVEKTEECVRIFWLEAQELYRYGRGWWTEENLEVVNESR